MISSLILSLIIFLVSGIGLLRLIQIKDYFFPSLWAHFDYPSSYYLFFRKREFLLILLWLTLIIYSLLSEKIYLTDNYLFIYLFILGFLIYLRREQIKLIKWNLKGLFIFSVIILINYRILDITQNDLTIVILLLTTAIQFSIVIFSLYLANILTKFYAKFLFKKAHQKVLKWLAGDKKRLVIGIAGSYGKTSTKEIIAQLLEQKYKVLKSPLRLNAEIGLAQFVLKNNLENYDILVLEMGTRQIGEVEQMVEIFHPRCAFLTGLAPQHLATFGSFENMIKGEMEIFKKTIPDGWAFLNGADNLVRKFYKDLTINQKYLYGHPEGHFYFKNEKLSLEKTDFIFVYPEGEIELTTNIVGHHFLENLTGALGLCYLLGIKPMELKEKLMNIQFLPNQFEVIKKSGPLIINDSYNANIMGIQKEIDFLNRIHSGPKILFFAGIIELGIDTQDIYQKMIDSFHIFDLVVLTFKDYTEIFKERLKDKVISYHNQPLKKILKKFNQENLAILILGRIPSALLAEIKKL